MSEDVRHHTATLTSERRLTRQNLHGVWAAIATPFDDCDRFDETSFRENIRRLAAAGVHGIYTTDSDGEFYAIELDEFQRVVDVFADETRRLGIASQVGVTWCNTQGMLDRLRHAAARGILGAHVGHPFFMDMTPKSYQQFWLEVAAAVPDDFALVHYNTPRVHNYQYGPDYAVLADLIPNLIGTKHTGRSFPEFLTLVQAAPQLAHFTGDHALTPYMMFGARGVHSWLTSFNAPYVVAWYQECLAGDWGAARHRQLRVHAFTELKRAVFGKGNYHAIVNKAVAAASDFLVGSHRTRRPYLPETDTAVAEFRQRVSKEFPDLMWNVRTREDQ